MPKISSHLRMKNVKLMQVEYGVSAKFKPELTHQSLNVSLNTTHKVRLNKKKTQAIVSLEIKLFKKNSEEFPIWFDVKNQAEFEWDEYNEKIETMLNTVAPAHLLSYIRPLISQLTTMSNFTALNLPLVDFSQDDKSD